MTTAQQLTEADAAVSRLKQGGDEALEVVARLEAAGKFVTSRFFVLQIIEGLKVVVQQEQSPFVNRQAAAARWFCSEDEIDRAAKPEVGILTPVYRGAAPLFEKAEGDAAIREGRWLKAGNKKQKAAMAA